MLVADYKARAPTSLGKLLVETAAVNDPSGEIIIMPVEHGSHQPPESLPRLAATPGGEQPAEDPDATLEDAARGEREYVRERLRRDLKREPTEDEINDWLRMHTEGY